MNATEDFFTAADWVVYELMHRMPQGFREDDILEKARRVGVTPQEMQQAISEWVAVGHLERADKSELLPAWRVRSRRQ